MWWPDRAPVTALLTGLAHFLGVTFIFGDNLITIRW
jgi:hypothetical protein